MVYAMPNGGQDQYGGRNAKKMQDNSSAKNVGKKRNKYHDIASSLLSFAPGDELDRVFLSAARDGDYEKIEGLLQRRNEALINVDARDSRTGNTALFWATIRGHTKIVQLLLRHGADVTLRNYEGQTVIEIANAQIRSMILESGERGGCHRNLLQSAWQGNARIVAKIISENRSVDINCRNCDGLTPLLLVARDLALFEKLGEKGAAQYEATKVVEHLLSSRADPNAVDEEGKSALHYISACKSQTAGRILNLLLDAESDIEAQDRRCFTPIHCASQSGSNGLVQALLDFGSDPNCRGFAGSTPLHISAINGHEDVTHTLLQHGADVTIVDDSGLTPVDVAKTKRVKATLKNAWTDATQAKSEQNLKPVLAMNRDNALRRSLDRIKDDRRRKGEVIFESILSTSSSTSVGDGLTPRKSPRKLTPLNHADKCKITEESLEVLEARGQIYAPFSSRVKGSSIRSNTPQRTGSISPSRRLTPIRNASPQRSHSQGKFESRMRGRERVRVDSAGKKKEALIKTNSDPSQMGSIPITNIGTEWEDNIQDLSESPEREERLLGLRAKMSSPRVRTIQGPIKSRYLGNNSQDLAEEEENAGQRIRTPSVDLGRIRIPDTIAEGNPRVANILNLEQMQLKGQSPVNLDRYDNYPTSKRLLPPTPLLCETTIDTSSKENSPRSDSEDSEETPDENKSILKEGTFNIEETRIRVSNDSGCPEEKLLSPAHSPNMGSEDSGASSGNTSRGSSGSRANKASSIDRQISRTSESRKSTGRTNKAPPSGAMSSKLRSVAKQNAAKSENVNTMDEDKEPAKFHKSASRDKIIIHSGILEDNYSSAQNSGVKTITVASAPTIDLTASTPPPTLSPKSAPVEISVEQVVDPMPTATRSGEQILNAVQEFLDTITGTNPVDQPGNKAKSSPVQSRTTSGIPQKSEPKSSRNKSEVLQQMRKSVDTSKSRESSSKLSHDQPKSSRTNPTPSSTTRANQHASSSARTNQLSSSSTRSTSSFSQSSEGKLTAPPRTKRVNSKTSNRPDLTSAKSTVSRPDVTSARSTVSRPDVTSAKTTVSRPDLTSAKSTVSRPDVTSAKSTKGTPVRPPPPSSANKKPDPKSSKVPVLSGRKLSLDISGDRRQALEVVSSPRKMSLGAIEESGRRSCGGSPCPSARTRPARPPPPTPTTKPDDKPKLTLSGSSIGSPTPSKRKVDKPSKEEPKTVISVNIEKPDTMQDDLMKETPVTQANYAGPIIRNPFENIPNKLAASPEPERQTSAKPKLVKKTKTRQASATRKTSVTKGNKRDERAGSAKTKKKTKKKKVSKKDASPEVIPESPVCLVTGVDATDVTPVEDIVLKQSDESSDDEMSQVIMKKPQSARMFNLAASDSELEEIDDEEVFVFDESDSLPDLSVPQDLLDISDHMKNLPDLSVPLNKQRSISDSSPRLSDHDVAHHKRCNSDLSSIIKPDGLLQTASASSVNKENLHLEKTEKIRAAQKSDVVQAIQNAINVLQENSHIVKPAEVDQLASPQPESDRLATPERPLRQKTEAELEAMIDDILKNTPNTTLTSTLTSTAPVAPPRRKNSKSRLQEDLRKSMEFKQFQEILPDEQDKVKPVAKSGSDQYRQIEDLVKDLKRMELQIDVNLDTNQKPPAHPAPSVYGHQKQEQTKIERVLNAEKSPRFVLKGNDSLSEERNSRCVKVEVVSDGRDDDQFSDCSSIVSEFGSDVMSWNQSTLNSLNESMVPTDGRVVTSRLGRRASSKARAESAASSAAPSMAGEETIEWKRGNMLGKGAFGTVWCGLTNSGELIAVKQIELNIDDMERAELEYEKIQEEVELLKNLRHKNIVGYLGTSLEEDVVSIFMQFVPGGSIANLLARFGALPEEVFANYTRQILEGVEYLHGNNVIHRDIKGGNIMVTHNAEIKLIDFGCAKKMCLNMSLGGSKSSKKRVLKSMRGTPYWMAPEVVQEIGYGTKSDIWSIGCTVFEMATRKPPWADLPPMSAIFAIGAEKNVPVLPEKFSEEARNFVSRCLTRDQHLRPSATELLFHSFIERKKKR